MIDSLHSGDDLHPLWVVLVNVLDQFRLCVGRTGNENGTSVRNRFHDGVKVIVILCGMSATDGVGFVMDVSRRMIRMQDESFDVCRVEMENARFAVIDPDDGMMVMVVHEIKSLSNDRSKMMARRHAYFARDPMQAATSSVSRQSRTRVFYIQQASKLTVLSEQGKEAVVAILGPGHFLPKVVSNSFNATAAGAVYSSRPGPAWHLRTEAHATGRGRSRP